MADESILQNDQLRTPYIELATTKKYYSTAHLDGFFFVLLKSKYISKTIREALIDIIAATTERTDLLEILSTTPSKLQHITKNARLEILHILKKYCSLIEAQEDEYSHVNYFHFDGTLKSDFVKFLEKSIDNLTKLDVVEYDKLKKCGTIRISTQEPASIDMQKIYEGKIIDYPSDGQRGSIGIEWAVSARYDDSFKFGDCLSSQWCVDTGYVAFK